MEISTQQRNEILVDFSKSQVKPNDKFAGLSEEIKVKPIEAQHSISDSAEKIFPPGVTADISFDKEINQMIVSIKSSEDGELIKTIPSKEILEFMRKMAEMAKENSSKGSLIDIKI
jgi:uncharacterized FlaG/YvyC family protein